MYQILLTREIKAPKARVWEVISRVDQYKEWNQFIVDCESTFEPGSPMAMEVNLGAAKPRHQVETITQHRPGEFLEYGMRVPLGLLSSNRHHLLTETDAGNTRYESMFQLRGLISPLVFGTMGSKLKWGFEVMTDGIVTRSEAG